MAVRGYADWKPKGDKLYWLREVVDLLNNDMRDEWPLTNRQVFYRLVGERSYNKTEKAYNDLVDIVARGRRAGYIEWQAIRDGGLGKVNGAVFYDDADHFYQSVKGAAKRMKLDRQQGQPQAIELWCEAGGMFDILKSVAEPYGCRSNTGGGYDSVTAKHHLAVRVADRAKLGLPTLVLHVGDFDGSGENMCEVLREDAGQMVVSQVARALAATYRSDGIEDDALEDFKTAPGWVWDDVEKLAEGQQDVSRQFLEWVYGWFKVERVALTGEQVVERDVITAPPKKSDSRTRAFIERNWRTVDALGTEDISAQLEALHPRDLRALISEVIEEHMDMDHYQSILDEEEGVRADLRRRLP